MRDEILNAVTEIASHFDIREGYVFGSYAHGNQHFGSDVDVAVDVYDSMEFAKFCDELDKLEFPVLFDVHNIHENALAFDLKEIRNGIKIC